MAGKRGVPLHRIPAGRPVYSIAFTSPHRQVRWALWRTKEDLERRSPPLVVGLADSDEAALVAITAAATNAMKVCSWWATPAGLYACREERAEPDAAAKPRMVNEAIRAEMATVGESVRTFVQEINAIRLGCRYTDSYARPGADDSYLSLVLAVAHVGRASPALETRLQGAMDALLSSRCSARGEA